MCLRFGQPIGVWGYGPRVDWERVAARSRLGTVPTGLHGVFGGRADARSPNQTRFAHPP